MNRRLVRLLERWAERETVKTCGRALPIPSAGFVWRRNKVGGWESGHYERGVFIQSKEASFNLIRGTAIFEFSDLDEFGCAMRGLSQVDQGLIIVWNLGDKTKGNREGGEEWREFLLAYQIPKEASQRMRKWAEKKLAKQCRDRGLI